MNRRRNRAPATPIPRWSSFPGRSWFRVGKVRAGGRPAAPIATWKSPATTTTKWSSKTPPSSTCSARPALVSDSADASTASSVSGYLFSTPMQITNLNHCYCSARFFKVTSPGGYTWRCSVAIFIILEKHNDLRRIGRWNLKHRLLRNVLLGKILRIKKIKGNFRFTATGKTDMDFIQ